MLIPSLRVATPLLPAHKILGSEAPWTPEATGPASFPATPAVAGNGGLSHFVLGDPITATVLAEGPSGHSEPQAEALLPVNHCRGRGEECPLDPRPAARAGSVLSWAHMLPAPGLSSGAFRKVVVFRAGICFGQVHW